MRDSFKQRLLQTPFEGVAYLAQDIPRWINAARHPQLRDVILEMPRMRKVIRRILKPDSNAIDVGCHIGMVLSQCLRHAPRGKHIACEAIPHKAAALREKFPRATIHQCAIGNQSGTAKFTIEQTLTGNSGLRNPGNDPNEFKTIDVEVKTIDELLEPSWRIDFMKLVIEGAELSAMQGAERTIREHRPKIIFGSTAEILACWDHGPQEIFDCVDNLGYDLRTLAGFMNDTEPLKLRDFEQAFEKPYSAFKFVAIPR